jgi:signal transduction histidine kinase
LEAALSSFNTPESQLSVAQILALGEESLTRIVLDIHDGPVQYLYAALSLHAQLVGMMAAAPPEQQQLVARIGSLIESAMGEIRATIGTMRLPEFHHRSLAAVVEGLAMQHENHTGSQVILHMDDLPPQVPLPVKIGIYRVLQEALSNSYRHAGAERHQVHLRGGDGGIHLTVSDEGKGFVPPNWAEAAGDAFSGVMESAHIGLRGMRNRVHLLGGSFSLESQPDQGTHITVWIPIYEQ